MKKSIFAIALAVAFVFVSCKENAAEKVNENNTEMNSQATSNEMSNQENSGKYPVMTFETKEHDFGRIAQGTNVEHLFKFTNTGEAPLILSDAKASCGCTVPTFTKDPIPPGGEGELLVKFNGSGQNQRTIPVTVTANTQNGTERLTVKVFVEPKEGASGASGLTPSSF